MVRTDTDRLARGDRQRHRVEGRAPRHVLVGDAVEAELVEGGQLDVAELDPLRLERRHPLGEQLHDGREFVESVARLLQLVGGGQGPGHEQCHGGDAHEL